MIVFDLKCSKGHFFEEWFDSSGDFEVKAADGSISCPQCGDSVVSKALMAPNISTTATPSASPCAQAASCGETSCPMAGRG